MCSLCFQRQILRSRLRSNSKKPEILKLLHNKCVCFVFLIENIFEWNVMNVMNTSGDDLPECPLCMEPLEVDDLSFYPCTCGYQICRFCWHRIRTDENELCPACRKAYPENPADFKPLTQEQVSWISWGSKRNWWAGFLITSTSLTLLCSYPMVQGSSETFDYFYRLELFLMGFRHLSDYFGRCFQLSSLMTATLSKLHSTVLNYSARKL